MFYCRFPPPFTGETIGSRTVYELLKDNIVIDRVEALPNRDGPTETGVWSLAIFSRTIKSIGVARRTVKRVRPEIFYFVAGASKLGNLRDFLCVCAVRPYCGRIVAHVRSGNFGGAVNKDDAAKSRLSGKVDRYIFLSDSLADDTRSFLPAGKSCVVRNAIDEGIEFQSNDIEKLLEERTRDGLVNIGFVGNMYASKGYWDVAVALTELGSKHEWKGHFVGGWPRCEDRRRLAEFFEKQELQRHVCIHGSVTQRESLKRIYGTLDVLVLPTYYEVEAQPRSIIEAFNAAVPVIATRHASIPEYVIDGVNGLLVDAKNPQQIASALRRMLNAPEERERMARAARRYYEDHFDRGVIRNSLMAAMTEWPA